MKKIFKYIFAGMAAMSVVACSEDALETDFPDLQFRYCSKCAGYHCFCEDHIFNHTHFTQ